MNEKILFLDDDRYEMLGIAERLTSEGFTVEMCTEPEEAKQSLRNGFRPHLIIADLIMRTNPSQTSEQAHDAGVEFIGIAREEFHLTCPIIVLTVVTDEKILVEARQYDVLVLTKAVTPRELVRRVKEKIQNV